jgi:hypothetical protein
MTPFRQFIEHLVGAPAKCSFSCENYSELQLGVVGCAGEQEMAVEDEGWECVMRRLSSLKVMMVGAGGGCGMSLLHVVVVDGGGGAGSDGRGGGGAVAATGAEGGGHRVLVVMGAVKMGMLTGRWTKCLLMWWASSVRLSTSLSST